MNKRAKLGIILGLMMTMCTACGSSSYDSSMAVDNAVAYPEMAEDSFFGEMENGASLTESKAESQESDTVEKTNYRKLIKTVNLDVETKEYDSLMSGISKQVEGIGGYIENMESYNGSRYYGSRNDRYANITIRIPADRLSEFIENISEECNVIRKSEKVDDVTLRYVDMASRRDALKVEQSRLLELMEQASTIEDIITIEDRLTKVRYELESMESQLRAMDNQVDYSTVYLNISEVAELTPVEEDTVWERITKGFSDSLEDIGEGIVEVFVWFVVSIPYFVIIAIIALAVLGIIIGSKKVENKKKAKKMKTDIQIPDKSEK